MSGPEYRDSCDVRDCEKEVVVEEYGVVRCEEHLDHETRAYLYRQARIEAEK